MVMSVEPAVAAAWQSFQNQMQLTDEQVDKFQRYYTLLIAWNERMNLTTITQPEQIIAYHFQDSLMVGNYVNLSTIGSIADIGSGAGFPGLPLKICYPQLTTYIIEVSHKRLQFLATVIKTLGLRNVNLIDFDWRTFLRKTQFPIDLFCARASLQPEELIRMFKPACPYKSAQLIYWAASAWRPTQCIVPFVEKEVSYVVGNKKRKFVFLHKPAITT